MHGVDRRDANHERRADFRGLDADDPAIPVRTEVQMKGAQRLLRHLERAADRPGAKPRSDFEALVAECAGLIEREVATLESLVDEFSQFARFPSARLAPADLNAIVSSALDVFQGRLEGIALHRELAGSFCRISRQKNAARGWGWRLRAASSRNTSALCGWRIIGRPERAL